MPFVFFSGSQGNVSELVPLQTARSCIRTIKCQYSQEHRQVSPWLIQSVSSAMHFRIRNMWSPYGGTYITNVYNFSSALYCCRSWRCRYERFYRRSRAEQIFFGTTSFCNNLRRSHFLANSQLLFYISEGENAKIITPLA